MNKVVLLSGGVDSTTCLAMAVARYGADKVTALTFLYGQKHSNELQNARNVAKHLGVELVEAEVSRQIFQGSKSTLLQGNGEISHESYADILAKNGEGVVDTYVPFRNGLMLSQAAALAYSKNADEVWYGAHSDDAAGSAYPDCTPEFYAAMESEMLERVNSLGIGPQGFGGRTTALSVAIEARPTHIAGLPVAVNVGCHVTRHAELEL